MGGPLELDDLMRRSGGKFSRLLWGKSGLLAREEIRRSGEGAEPLGTHPPDQPTYYPYSLTKRDNRSSSALVISSSGTASHHLHLQPYLAGSPVTICSSSHPKWVHRSARHECPLHSPIIEPYYSSTGLLRELFTH